VCARSSISFQSPPTEKNGSLPVSTTDRTAGVDERRREDALQLHGQGARQRVHVVRIVEPDDGRMVARALDAHERAGIVLELADVLVIREILHHTSENGAG